MTPETFDDDESTMRRALELARRGLGFVEPNPMVGAVIIDDDRRLLGEGYHECCGGPHAEIEALNAAGDRAAGGTLFVTLEPCCHHGKTGPCTDAVISSGIRRVIVGTVDPNPQVSGKGIAQLQSMGIAVETGLLEEECRRLIAPFSKRITTGRPWVHAKWAMTLDGKLAARGGHSQWISNESSRAVVHQLRGRMDAVIVGAGTVSADDPLLTARPPGPRTALRVMVSATGKLPDYRQLAKTANEFPTAIATTKTANEVTAPPGVEVITVSAAGDHVDLGELLRELGRREFTNVLVEGGAQLLGAFHDAGLIDECHVFIAPKLVGGNEALSPIGGIGLDAIPELPTLERVQVETLDSDIYIRGFVQH